MTPMPSIGRDDVARLADLARIQLTDEEIDRFAGEFDSIMDAVASVSEVATADVPATSHPIPMTNVFRKDVVTGTLTGPTASPAQLEALVHTTETQLLTPVGLHTLSPLDPRYRGDYGGPQVLRDAAYHQGTVWPWPLGAYVELLLGRGEVVRARAALEGLTGHLWEAGLGHVSEVFAGGSLRPGGCPFQAWSVAELLRAHVLVCRAEASGRP